MKHVIYKGIAGSLSLMLALSTAFMAPGLDGVVATARANMTYDIETEEEKEEAGNHKGKGDKTKKVEETDYIVTLKNDSCYKKMENSARENDLFSETSLRADAELEENQMMVLKLSEDEASQIEEIGGVEEIEEDLSMTANEVIEPDMELVEEAIEQNKGIDFNQWNLNAINLPQCCFNIDDEECEKETDVDDITGVNTTKAAISSKKCHMGKGVKIAILDSGISYGAGTPVKERINFLDNADASSPVFDDVTGHGTGIAGIISADGSQGLLQGIAPGAEIYSLRVLDQENSAPVSRIISGIYWCIENDMDVINMSFGMSRYSSALEKAVNDAKAAGIIMTAAAGNHGDSVSSIDYPAAFDGVIAVGATDGENKLTDFTSKGKGINILAPGEKIWTSGYFDGIITVDGTSIATAHVTGAVALLLEKYPEADSTYIQQLLKASSAMVEEETGLGLLDVESALEMGEEFVPVEAEEKIMPQEKKLDTYDTEGIVTGCWGKNEHESLIQTEEVEVELNPEDLGWVVKAAGLVDDQCGTDDYDKKELAAYNPRYGLLHGQHNYVVMLKFLYKTARKTPDSGVTLANRQQAKQFLNTINVTHTYDVSYGDQDIKDMRDLVADIFSSSHGVSMCSKATTKKERAWVLMGVAAHLLGDIYAHRSMMPGAEFATAKMNENHFNDWDGFKDKVFYSAIEFRDIKMYMKDEIKKKTQKYEDNDEFYPGRYYASEVAIKNLLTAYKAGDTFGVKKIIMNGTESHMNRIESYMNIPVPVKINLNNFQYYTWSSGSTDDVSIMSTGNYRANIVNGGVQKNEWDYVDYDHYVY